MEILYSMKKEYSTNEVQSPQSEKHQLYELSPFVNQEAQRLYLQSVHGGLAGFFLESDFPVCFVSDRLFRILGFDCDTYNNIFSKSILSSIHPDDRDKYSEALSAVLAGGEIFDPVIRVKDANDRYLWMQDIGRQTTIEGKAAFLILRTDMTAIAERQRALEEKAALYEEKIRQLETLNANIPGGICEVELDEYFTLAYGNKGFYKLFGYTAEQLAAEHGNRLYEVVYDKDRKYVKQIIEEASRKRKSGFQFEHRIVRRDGTLVWILVRGGHLSLRQGKSFFNCVVIDITDRKKVEDEARMSERRFRIALAQTDSTIFEYDICSKVMIHGDRSAEYYGLEQRTENVPQALLESGVVHPDSAGIFLEMYQKITDGLPSASCVVKVKLKDGPYTWRKISMTTIYDEDGNPVQAVGCLEDIDEQVRREESLRYQSERDPLTGLYNRAAMQKRIEKELQLQGCDVQSALLILDIDEFKTVNDQFGHMFGDYVLSESAKRIAAIFHDDIVARIGGDEYIVFIRSVKPAELAQKTQLILKAYEREFSDRGIYASVSCSVGAAVCPDDGETFEDLYQNADIALYRAKNNGKNKTVLYQDSMAMPGGWVPYSNTCIDI